MLQKLALARGVDALVGHDRQGPQHENKTRLLLEVAHDDVDRTLLDIVGIDLHLRRPLGEHRIGSRADDRDIDGVYQDDGDKECAQLINELDRKLFSHRLALDIDGKGNSTVDG